MKRPYSPLCRCKHARGTHTYTAEGNVGPCMGNQKHCTCTEFSEPPPMPNDKKDD